MAPIKYILFFISAVLPLSLGGCGLVLPSTPAGDFGLAFNLPESGDPVEETGEACFTEESVFESIPGLIGHHAATITAFSDGELLAGWYSYSGEFELDGSAIYLSRRPAGSAVWQPPQLHIDREHGDGNPVLYSEGDNVWLFQAVVPYGWSTAHIEFQRSTDRGVTWTEPAKLSWAIGSNTRYPPVRLADGQLLLPAYDEIFQRSLFFVSTDGIRWSYRSGVSSSPGNIQPSVAVLTDGRLLAVMRNQVQGWLWTMVSDNAGKSWSAPQDSGFPNPGSAAQILRLAGGNLVLIFNDSAEYRHPLSIALSGDEGRTWPYKKILVDGEGAYSYPTAVQSPDGRIHLLYSYNRERINHIILNEAWIIQPHSP